MEEDTKVAIDEPVLTKTPITTTTQSEINQDSKNMALLAWIGAIFLGFIPPLILMLTKTEDPFIQRHSKESLNLAITSLIIYIVCIFTSFLIIPIFIMIILGIANLVFCIMAAVKASNGEDYRVPMPMLRLIK